VTMHEIALYCPTGRVRLYKRFKGARGYGWVMLDEVEGEGQVIEKVMSVGRYKRVQVADGDKHVVEFDVLVDGTLNWV
jgi:hypothetical protein